MATRVIIIAPSCGGKTTLARHLLLNGPNGPNVPLLDDWDDTCAPIGSQWIICVCYPTKIPKRIIRHSVVYTRKMVPGAPQWDVTYGELSNKP